jgi:hypothetical protein
VPGEVQARALAARLERDTEFEVRVTSQAGGLLRKPTWAVAATKQPVTVAEPELDAWVAWLVDAGLEAGCTFDGWGAPVPGSDGDR